MIYYKFDVNMMRETYMKIFLIRLLVLIFCLWTGVVMAQSRADIRIDTTQIRTGEQISLLLEYRFPKGSKIDWPLKADTITKTIEIVRKLKADTITNSDGLTSIRQRYIITSFDSGPQVIPPLRFGYLMQGDSTAMYTETEAALIMVNTPEVDTTQVIKAIKSPLSAPLSFWELLPWLIRIWSFIGLVLIVFVIYYYYKKGRLPLLNQNKNVRLPADDEAMLGLENLRLKKLWQNGYYKLYFSEMTDIIRVYIERRFDVMAVEMTTEEIMTNIKPLNINKEVSSKLHEVLQLADLVKFAKAEPMPLESDLSLQHCIDFVKETAPSPEDSKEEETENITDKNPKL